MPPAPSAPIAFSALCVGISAAVLLPILSESPPGAVVDAAQAASQAQLDPAPHGVLAAVATFFTAITITYVHLRTGGRGGASTGDWRIPEVMFFILCTSVAFVELFLCIQPGPVQAPVLLIRVAAVQLLPYAGAATFFLSLVLTYVHVGAAGGAGSGNEEYPAAVELLNTMTLAATLVTSVFSSITAALVFNTK